MAKFGTESLVEFSDKFNCGSHWPTFPGDDIQTFDKSITLQRVKLWWRNLAQRFFLLISQTILNVGHLELLFDLLFQVTHVWQWVTFTYFWSHRPAVTEDLWCRSYGNACALCPSIHHAVQLPVSVRLSILLYVRLRVRTSHFLV